MKADEYKPKKYTPEKLFMQKLNSNLKAINQNYNKTVWKSEEIKRRYLKELIKHENRKKLFKKGSRKDAIQHLSEGLLKHNQMDIANVILGQKRSSMPMAGFGTPSVSTIGGSQGKSNFFEKLRKPRKRFRDVKKEEYVPSNTSKTPQQILNCHASMELKQYINGLKANYHNRTKSKGAHFGRSVYQTKMGGTSEARRTREPFMAKGEESKSLAPKIRKKLNSKKMRRRKRKGAGGGFNGAGGGKKDGNDSLSGFNKKQLYLLKKKNRMLKIKMREQQRKEEERAFEQLDYDTEESFYLNFDVKKLSIPSRKDKRRPKASVQSKEESKASNPPKKAIPNTNKKSKLKKGSNWYNNAAEENSFGSLFEAEPSPTILIKQANKQISDFQLLKRGARYEEEEFPKPMRPVNQHQTQNKALKRRGSRETTGLRLDLEVKPLRPGPLIESYSGGLTHPQRALWQNKSTIGVYSKGSVTRHKNSCIVFGDEANDKKSLAVVASPFPTNPMATPVEKRGNAKTLGEVFKNKSSLDLKKYPASVLANLRGVRINTVGNQSISSVPLIGLREYTEKNQKANFALAGINMLQDVENLAKEPVGDVKQAGGLEPTDRKNENSDFKIEKKFTKTRNFYSKKYVFTKAKPTRHRRVHSVTPYVQISASPNKKNNRNLLKSRESGLQGASGALQNTSGLDQPEASFKIKHFFRPKISATERKGDKYDDDEEPDLLKGFDIYPKDRLDEEKEAKNPLNMIYDEVSEGTNECYLAKLRDPMQAMGLVRGPEKEIESRYRSWSIDQSQFEINNKKNERQEEG